MTEGFKQGRHTQEGVERDLVGRAERLFSTLDTRALGEIFQEERKRSGVLSDDPEFNIAYDPSLPADGVWRDLEKTIVFNLERAYRSLQKDNEYYNRSQTFENYLASGFIHELTHAYGHNSCAYPEPQELLKAVLKTIFKKDPVNIQQMGYVQRDVKRGLPKTKYNYFNEAITDMIAGEVFTEYKKRTADDDLEDDYQPSYLVPRTQLEAFIVLVSKHTDTAPEEVWKAIKQGYFSGLNLDESDLGSIYDDLIISGLGERKQTDEEREVKNDIVRKVRLDSDVAGVSGKSGDFIERIRFALRALDESIDRRGS